MARTRQLARLLQPFVGGRAYGTAAKHAARAGEEVAAVSNAHRAADSVMEVCELTAQQSQAIVPVQPERHCSIYERHTAKLQHGNCPCVSPHSVTGSSYFCSSSSVPSLLYAASALVT